MEDVGLLLPECRVIGEEGSYLTSVVLVEGDVWRGFEG